MPITLAELIRNAQARIGEGPDSEGFDDPFQWPQLVVRAVDKIADATDCILFNRRFALPVSGYWGDIRNYTLPPGFRQAKGGVGRSWYLTDSPVNVVGFLTPGEAWEYDAVTGEELPLAPTSICPAPSYAIHAIETQLALLRASQFPKTYGDKIAILTAQLRDEQGDVEKRAAREYELARRTF